MLTLEFRRKLDAVGFCEDFKANGTKDVNYYHDSCGNCYYLCIGRFTLYQLGYSTVSVW